MRATIACTLAAVSEPNAQPREDAPREGAAEDADVTRGRRLAYALTWTSYATYYLGRKGLPVAKATLEGLLGKAALYGVETVYLASYAVGQYVNGWLGDRVGARRLLGVGMLASSLACFAFGASGAGTLFIVAWLANGLAQSTGWPGNIKAMAEWTPPEKRGAVMGMWSTCYQIGGIIATNIAVRFLKAWGWSWAFYGPALIIAAVGVAVLLLLKPGPLARKQPSKDAADAAPAKAALAEARRRLVRSPMIWSLGACYFSLKLIRYSLLFSSQYYLEKILHYETKLAADISTAFEWGGVAGAIVIGIVSDRYRTVPRTVIAGISLVGLAAAFGLYVSIGGAGIWANVVCLALIGFLLFGPDALVSGAAAQDAGGAEAAALAAGLINGIGSVGAIFQEAVTRGVSERWGWNGLFRVFVGLSLFGVICLAPTFRRRAPAAA
ncbi:Glycerol-3-phosphate transporter [Minicystis rosea]|nr:Glycerol-3-phosphate transporter [Minicystis rosea]